MGYARAVCLVGVLGGLGFATEAGTVEAALGLLGLTLALLAGCCLGQGPAVCVRVYGL